MSAHVCLPSSGLLCLQVPVVDNNSYFQDVDVLDEAGLENDWHSAVAASICVTIMSELGDKSFFMSAILAMHHSRTLTFIGSMLGQIIMTGVAVTLGMAASLVPDVYTKWVSCICMTFFGMKMLKDGFNMTAEEGGCLDQNENIIHEKIRKYSIKTELIELEDESSKNTLQLHEISTTKNTAAEENRIKSKQMSEKFTEGVLMQAFTLSFLGEWGDRSQIATILLASNENPYGVAVGSVLGHTVCSLTAVIGGRLLGQKFPVKTMTQAGGVVFLLCAASSIIFE